MATFAGLRRDLEVDWSHDLGSVVLVQGVKRLGRRLDLDASVYAEKVRLPSRADRERERLALLKLRRKYVGVLVDFDWCLWQT